MIADSGGTPVALRVVGGMTVNDWTMQRLADLLGVPVERPGVTETTALGAAYLAGLHTGLFGGLAQLPRLWARDRPFDPGMHHARTKRRDPRPADTARARRPTAAAH